MASALLAWTESPNCMPVSCSPIAIVCIWLRPPTPPAYIHELRELADAIMAHATLGGLHPAAKSLGISHQTLQRRFVRVGLELSLFGRDA